VVQKSKKSKPVLIADNLVFKGPPDNTCVVCDRELGKVDQEPMFGMFGNPMGWKCNICNSMYDLEGELMLIGDFKSTVRGET